MNKKRYSISVLPEFLETEGTGTCRTPIEGTPAGYHHTLTLGPQRFDTLIYPPSCIVKPTAASIATRARASVVSAHGEKWVLKLAGLRIPPLGGAKKGEQNHYHSVRKV